MTAEDHEKKLAAMAAGQYEKPLVIADWVPPEQEKWIATTAPMDFVWKRIEIQAVVRDAFELESWIVDEGGYRPFVFQSASPPFGAGDVSSFELALVGDGVSVRTGQKLWWQVRNRTQCMQRFMAAIIMKVECAAGPFYVVATEKGERMVDRPFTPKPDRKFRLEAEDASDDFRIPPGERKRFVCRAPVVMRCEGISLVCKTPDAVRAEEFCIGDVPVEDITKTAAIGVGTRISMVVCNRSRETVLVRPVISARTKRWDDGVVGLWPVALAPSVMRTRFEIPSHGMLSLVGAAPCCIRPMKMRIVSPDSDMHLFVADVAIGSRVQSISIHRVPIERFADWTEVGMETAALGQQIKVDIENDSDTPRHIEAIEFEGPWVE